MFNVVCSQRRGNFKDFRVFKNNFRLKRLFTHSNFSNLTSSNLQSNTSEEWLTTYLIPRIW